MPDDPQNPPQDPRESLRRDMLRGFITEPLLSEIHADPDAKFHIIISLNEAWPEGVEAARALAVAPLQTPSFVQTDIPRLGGGRKRPPPPTPPIYTITGNYIFVELRGNEILRLAEHYYSGSSRSTGTVGRRPSPVYRIWKDEVIRSCLTNSCATVKADAAHRAFQAVGSGITWAVLDSGINNKHPHFKLHDNISKKKDWHQDFVDGKDPFDDAYGHGTHVAGIIAGEWCNLNGQPVAVQETLTSLDALDQPQVATQPVHIERISGIAPKAKLVSMKVLDAKGSGRVSHVLRAIARIQEINDHGRRLTLPDSAIHGVNLSLGYDFNPKWFGCGQSPLCVEVNRLVRSGVAVVVAVGNSGYGALSKNDLGVLERGYRNSSVNDPGNAELAITVGSTHRDQPHTYGISYFSSRGPTGDGRLKPDLVAPGERIFSCAQGLLKQKVTDEGSTVPAANLLYLEQNGTSMAAPHVSGAIAAFLSVRREFIGRPEVVKQLFLENAIDLRRERAYQGHGLVDLMKVLQAV